MQKEKDKYVGIPEMLTDTIAFDNFNVAKSKTYNWKFLGPDLTQNIWIERCNFLHQKDVNIFGICINDSKTSPPILAEGITYLLPKVDTFQKYPFKGRPIKCLFIHVSSYLSRTRSNNF
ncbi:hypothetical protein ACFFRR_005859 [Megaselia abdita]